MTGLGALLKKELRESWRTYRLAVVGILFGFLGLSSPLVTRYLPDIVAAFAPPGVEVTFPPPTVGDVLDQLLKNVLQFGVLAGVLLAMGSVANEKERGTAALILVKPVSRAAFLAAKLLAVGIVLAVGVGVSVAAALVYTVILFEGPDIGGWILMAGVIWLSIVAYASITFLGSVVTRSALGAAGIGFGGLIVLALASAVPAFARWLPSGLTPVARAIGLGDAGAAPDAALTTLATVAIIAATVVGSWVAFRRQEL